MGKGDGARSIEPPRARGWVDRLRVAGSVGPIHNQLTPTLIGKLAKSFLMIGPVRGKLDENRAACRNHRGWSR